MIDRYVRLISITLLSAVLLLAGCSSFDITYVDDGASYTRDAAEALARKVATDRFENTPTSDAETLRREALIELRGMGSEASDLADLLTQLFPTDNRAIPYYAEAATLDSQDAWIVVEAWGQPDGTLDSTRLWVFDRETGMILLAAVTD